MDDSCESTPFLSFGQERLWFLDRFDPGNPVYHLSTALHLTGPLDRRALELGLNEVIRRHDVLRTIVAARAGQPVPGVAPRPEVAIALQDLAALGATARRAEVPRLAVACARQVFDLERGPLLRAALLRLAEAEHVLLLTVHRLVADTDSLDLLHRELFEHYQAFSAVHPAPAPGCGRPEPPIRYAEFARRQRQWLQGEDCARQLAYWKGRLAGAPAVIELPTDHPRGAVVTFRGARRSLVLSPALTEALRAFRGREGVSLPTLFLAAFKVLLRRTTGREDVVVGSLPADRDRAETAGLIGPTVNPLVLRTDLADGGSSRGLSCRQLLERISTTLREAGEHRNLPFERLVEELQPQRDMSHHPLFQVMFIFREAPASLPELPALKVRPLEIDYGTARFDLTLKLGEGEGGAFTAALEFGADLFDPTTTERLLGHFECLLAGIVEDPEQRLRQLPWLTEAEQHQLLAEWNDTALAAPLGPLFHELFERQVIRRPEAVAVVFEGQRLSYRELDRRANQLAHYLRVRGVGGPASRPEALVGVCVERSPEMVVGILGILKAGGAWLPLDPEYPRERLAFMVADTRLPVILTQERLLGALPEHEALVVCLDSEWDAVTAESTAKLPCGATAEHIAYVIYTSGSTGRPKGVAVHHRGLSNLSAAQIRLFDLPPEARILQFSSLNFDASVWEIAMVLSVGATLHLAPRERLLPGPPLLGLLREQRITCITLPPSALAVLGAQELPALTTLIVAGEASSSELARQWSAGRRFYNAYGPTETTVCATAGRYFGGPRLPIGTPIANTRVHLLDRHLEIVPVGVVGELRIGGTSTARGYLNRPALTAERFLPDPFAGKPAHGGAGPPRAGARLYRTGDLARYLPDGTIEFLGRIDHQVKLRGFRIELGEIEVVLAQHPMVREAVVLMREPASGESRLVAYLVVAAGAATKRAELREFLRQRLPEYMVPGEFVELESLPLTPSGKVDRAALPAPEAAGPGRATAAVAPRTPVEEVVAGIWAEVLDLERVGIHESFFDLGGHSLLATRVMARLRDAFGVELPLQVFFENATIGALAAHVEIARREELELVAPPLVPVPRDRRLPLSFAQQRLWFLDRFKPQSAVYNLPNAFRLHGPLDRGALKRSLDEIVRRHEVLRTRLVEVDAQPCQVISAPPPFPLPVVELATLEPAARETELLRLAHEEARRPFRLAEGPLLRAALLRLGPEEHIFLLSIHHVAADGWSMGIFHRELELLYAASVAGRASAAAHLGLPELPIQYADFAVWQRRWLEREEVWESQLAYWKAQLRGMPDSLELPWDRPRPPIRSYRGAKHPLGIDRALTEDLELLGRRRGTTLFMVLLVVFQALLHRITGQEDVTVGSAIANRNRSETEGLIGFFVNTLLLRSDLAGDPARRDPRFRELLGRAREVTLGAYAHQDLPFEKLVEELQPQRDLSRQPLFQVMFVLQNTPGPVLELPGLTASPLAVDNGTAKFDLTLSLDQDETGLSGYLEYDTDLVDRTTISRLVESLDTLSQSAVASPEQRLSELPILTPAGERQLLLEWNDTGSPYPREASIHELFEEQAAARSEAVAVVFADSGKPAEQVSYRELNRRANRLAHTLRSRGVQPETCVGLCAERSVEMVVGILGILKAGGAYVPLDPSYPPERLAFMVEDACSADDGPPVLLVQERLADRLPGPASSPGFHRIDLDASGSGRSHFSSENPSRVATAENLAYVMYTSGSTGRPKGVSVVHRGVVRLVRGANYAELDDRQVLLQFAPISFDASTLEIWGALVTGGRLVVFPPHTPSLQELGSVLDRHRVTTLWLTAGLFHQMVDENPAGLGAVRQLLAGGDVLSAVHLRRVLEALPGCTLINGYGPTESTTFTCCSPMRAAAEVDDSVSIGRPISNTRVYVLDRRLRPVPAGVFGELTIGGDGLARGYLSRPGLTAESLVPAPLGEVPGARLYRTGDVVRFLADGRIEFLGRRDDQVKVRGFRIELAEVEAHLGRHPGVRECAVVAQDHGAGGKRLLAFVVARGEPAPAPAKLRGFLRETLPEYMVPAAFVPLLSLPLTPNGKVDRAALGRRAPEETGFGSEEDFIAPRTPTEEVLAGLWSRLLGHARIGIHDHFFELGGHSLLATQLVSRVRDLLGVELPVHSVFRTPTLAGLADAVDRARRAGQGRVAPPIRPLPRDRELPLSFAQQRLWFLAQLQPASAVYNIPLALEFRGALHRPALEGALHEIVRRHAALRTRFASRGGEPYQVLCAPVFRTLPVVDLMRLEAGERAGERARLAGEEARKPFDLARGPLVRSQLLRLGEAEHVLLITQHHVVSDGWSLEVFDRELAVVYEAFADGRNPALPELGIQYADFACWQRQWLRGDVLDDQLGFWKEHLAGTPGALELPCDRPRPAVVSYRGTTRSAALPPRLGEALKALSRRRGCTLFMTMLAAFKVLLHRYTGQGDVVVGSLIANRDHSEIEVLIGFFVNTLVLRTDLAGDPGFHEVLARVREVALQAYAHQDLPFEKLVEELQPERDLSRNPFFQIAFHLLNMPSSPFDLPELAVRRREVRTGTAKFDLELAVTETGEELTAVAEYATDLFDGTTILRLLGSFRTLLEAVVTEPHRPLSELPLYGASARQQLLIEWNDSGSAVRRGTSIHALFEAQVEATPEAAAIVCADEHLSYRELNRRANRLAHYLQALGVGPEAQVGISMERSPEMVVGILGILKSGGAYLPLDPGYPRDRLAFMLEDARARVVVTQQRLLATLPEHRGRVVAIDGDQRTIAAHGAINPAPAATADNLAYVIYTSGSTGRAKGVAIEHRSTVAMLQWAAGVFTAEELAGVLGSTSICFDLSIFELFLPLTRGGTVIVAASALDLPVLAAGRVTLVNTVPSAFRELVRLADLPASVRTVNLAGEPLPRELAEAAYRHPGVHRVFNLYGPSEDTTYSTFARLERGHTTAPSIGRAVADTRACLLDRYLRPVPIGVPGELYLGGQGLARGYLERPGLTAERFVPDPFRRTPGERLYRTGDLVRLRPDGAIEFLGRIDHQVKLRGFRIELGEVEAVLGGHSGVRETAVVIHREAPGDRLVAYVVPQAEGVAADQLRDFLRPILPEYMVPSIFLLLEDLPLHPNGKVDRAALSRRPLPAAAAQRSCQEPRDPLEELLADIWQQLLGVERVGVHDDFFELGGHSLLATRVLSQVRRKLGIELELRILFKRPTVAGLAGYVATLLRRGEELVAPPLRRSARRGPPPLSFAQQRLWFLDRFAPGSALYNIPIALCLTGRLDQAALGRALAEIVRRHEVLRTTFETVDGEPVQVIRTAHARPLPVFDLSALATPRRRAEARRLAFAEARRPFDLVRGPVLRAGLLRLGAAEHVLYLTVHHIAFDGWSIGVLLRELTVLYQAFSAGRSAPGLPEPEVQYADFALWQRQWLVGEVLESQLGYWRKELAQLPVVELPCDRPRPAVRTFRGATEDFRLPAELYRRLRALSRQQGTTLFMTLLAAFQTLVGRYTGQEDVAAGSPIANRNRAEIEGLLGFFVNTLVLRGDLRGDPAVTELLARVREVALAAYAHQDLPFEHLVEELSPQRDLSQNPLVQVVFLLQNAATVGRRLAPGLELSLDYVATGTAKFDLTLGLEETADDLRGDLEYDRDLFDRTTVRRLVDHFATLLGSIVDAPERRLSELDQLGAAERQQLTVEWSGAAGRLPAAAAGIHELFAARAAARPTAVAVSCGERAVSYGELDACADRIAGHLRVLGAGRSELCVALCLERSIEMVAVILGILKTGAAYVPLDPDYPTERLAFMLEDVRAPLLVTQERFRERLPRLPDVRTVLIEGIPGEPAPAAAAAVRADQLAYVMFTSGSTGRPKGVGVAHRAVMRLVCGTDFARLDADETWLQFAPISFDAATLELWGPLLNGGRLVVFPPWTPSLHELGTEIRSRRVTALWLTAGLFHQMVDENLDGLRGVRQLLAGGDVLSPRHVRRVLERLPGTTVVNGYGPTENTTFTCCHAMHTPADVDDPVAVGRPISGTRVHVLDAQLRPSGIGIPGELCAGGSGLARGYLDRPGLTAASFVPDPSGGVGERLYRTGDVVRRLADGRIEFLGRRDQQVKVRGFRVELGEVEATLDEHPQVRDAVVVAVEQRLVAFVVAAGDTVPTPEQLRDVLRSTLPESMVPSVYVVLDRLPLTPNGKVDRTALARAAGRTAAADGVDYVAPRTPTEELMAGLWSQVLRRRVGIYDDFFALGGHSLLATQLISRLREAFGVELPLRSIFEAPTVAGLSARVEQARSAGDRTVPAMRPIARDGDLELSFSQLRQWFLVQFDPGTAAYNIPTAFRFRGRLRPVVLAAALDRIVERQESLRTWFATVDGRPVQRILPCLELPLPVVDLAALPITRRRNELELLAVYEGRWPFDLGRPPLLRQVLVRLADDEHVLLLTIHHIIADGWSLGVFAEEIAACYAAAVGVRRPLPALGIQYADFAHWQQEWLSGEVLAAQLAWWRSRLESSPAAVELPLDRPRPALRTYSGKQLPVRLPDGLRQLAQTQGATVFTVLLAVFGFVLGRHARQDRFNVGTYVANRRFREIEPLIGFFVNTLVLPVDLGGDPEFRRLLARVRETTLGAWEHQDLPFEKLLEELDPERDLSRSPLFQPLLAVLNFPAPETAVPELQITNLTLSEEARAHYDLALWVEEGKTLSGQLQFNTDLFDHTTAGRMVTQLELVLATLAEHCDRRLSDLPLLTPAARQQLLREWGGDEHVGAPSVIHDFVVTQAARRPEAVAVVDGDCRLSHGELEVRSNRLARHLLAFGVTPEQVIAVCLERRVDLLVAVLAVLKAGAAYLALDPGYPPRRLAFMLADSAAPLVLTRRCLAAGLPAGSARVLCLDDEAPAIAARAAAPPTVAVDPDQLAYVVYTSGSTGRPKGVMVSHRSLTATWRAWNEDYGLLHSPGRHLQMASPSFDVFTGDWTRALCSGGRLVSCPRDTLLAPAELYALMRRERVDCAEFVPAVVRTLVDHLVRTGETLDFMRLMIVGSDTWHLPEYEALKRLCGSRTRLINSYGVAEATIDNTWFEHAAVPLGAEKAVPIGRPFPGNRILLLDRRLRPVPAGVFAELFIGGAGLARGYRGRPAMTAERFVPGPHFGSRLYRTGDLARHLGDGNVEFLGRVDQQVKIRGFRIEPGEIEGELAAHPSVRRAAVLVRAEPAGDRRLIGYVVAEPGNAPAPASLRDHLKERLPDYMVPVAVVVLDEMPVTPNGKVDYRALPAPDAGQLGADDEFVPPETPAEQTLAEIWQRLLGVERVGIYDDFFELGGHSLLVPRLTSQVKAAFQVDLPVRVIFEAPTIADLALVIEEMLLDWLESEL